MSDKMFFLSVSSVHPSKMLKFNLSERIKITRSDFQDRDYKLIIRPGTVTFFHPEELQALITLRYINIR